MRRHLAADIGLAETDAGCRQHFTQLGKRVVDGLTNLGVRGGKGCAGLIAVERDGYLNRAQLGRIDVDLGNLLVVFGQPDDAVAKIMRPARCVDLSGPVRLY